MFDNPYARLLREQSIYLGEAMVRGTTAAIGDYPAYRPGAGEVRGELYQLRAPEETLRALDEYEGDAYERVLIDCDGRQSWIYQQRDKDGTALEV
jgi:gamma-glutamylcyclotransferase (GGCT)/AIG2-like uncharacterized protein YtfP